MFAPALDEAIGCLPSESLRAFARLALSAVVARRHLSGTHPDGWPGFVALGPTGTGKTLIAKLICATFGLRDAQAIRLLIAGHETFGSLFVRRERDGDGWRPISAPHLELPFVCLDEYDKAPGELRAACGGLLLGAAEADHEGLPVRVRPIVYLAMNRTPARALDAVLPDAFIRRAVVIDTEPLAPLLVGLDEQAHRLLSGAVAIPRIDLDRLRPPETLPHELRDYLRKLLRACLTDDGFRLTQVDALAKGSLGRAALIGGDLAGSTTATAIDYLTCAATLGHAVPGTAAALSRLTAGGPLSPDLGSVAVEADRRERLQAERETARQRERLQFVADRERVASQLREIRRALPNGRTPHEAVEVAVLRRVFEVAEQNVRGTRSRQSLDATQRAIARFVAQGQATLEAREHEQRLLAQQSEAERQRGLAERQRQNAAKQAAREQRRQLDAALRRLEADIDKLERLRRRKRGDPLTALAATTIRVSAKGQAQDLPLVYLKAGIEHTFARTLGRGLGAIFMHAAPDQILEQMPTGYWRSAWDPLIAYEGTEQHCAALETWDSWGVRRVIDAPHRALTGHRAKLDALIAQLGPSSTPRAQDPAPLRPPRPAAPTSARDRTAPSRSKRQPERSAERRPTRAASDPL
ncbi:MAG TPA: hypothetical protein VEF89_32235 [Solirubrobacteraceae bacterium]|nr:hypothetical protein [Solirubrobacteraceae bacterium]